MSDFEDQQRKKRLDDLENKRKRLEEMRKMKKDRVQTSTSPLSAAAAPEANNERINVDDLVNSLLSPSPAAAVSISSESEPASVSVVAPHSSLNPMTNFGVIRRLKAQELVTVSNMRFQSERRDEEDERKIVSIDSLRFSHEIRSG
jgi:hypothetical protein